MRTEVRLAEVEDKVQKARTEVGKESNDRKAVEMRTEVRLAEVEDMVQKARTEVGKESNDRKAVDMRTEMRLAEVEDKVEEARTEVGKESSDRKAVDMRTEVRLAGLDEKIQEIRAEVDKLRDLRDKISIEESVKDMEAKVRMSMCKVKVGNINIGMMTDNKATIVRKVLGKVRERTRLEETGDVNRVLKRTRVVVLGKRTEVRQSRGRTVYTVPILFECQDRKDAQEIDKTLRDAGYFPTFHWPSETMEFIRNIREKVRKMGHTEENSYVRIRPQVREGTTLIRVDAKLKVGGGCTMKGIWVCPPLNRMLWEGLEGLYTPQGVDRGSTFR